MKITINTDTHISDTEIVINCKQLTPEVEKLISMIRILNKQVTGIKDGETYLLDVQSLLYAEVVEKKVFLYTSDKIYNSNLKLYELEEQLEDVGFFRINKSCLVNLKNVSSLKADFDRRIKVTLNNGEKLIVSRQFADDFKKRLGVEK